MSVVLKKVQEGERSWSGDMTYNASTFHVEIYAVNHEGVAFGETNIWEPEHRPMVWPDAVHESRHVPTRDIAVQMAAWKIAEAVKEERNGAWVELRHSPARRGTGPCYFPAPSSDSLRFDAKPLVGVFLIRSP